MSTLRQIALGLGLIGAIVALIWLQQIRLESAQADKITAQNRAATAEQSILGHKAVIGELEQSLAGERAAQSKLRTQQAGIRQQLAAREKLIEDLRYENQELRDWSDVPLPAAARRLRQRPAITGAAGYESWLSGGGALHAERHSADTQREPAERR